MEFQCVTGILQSDDDSIPQDCALQKFSDSIRLAGEAFGTKVDDPMRWKGCTSCALQSSISTPALLREDMLIHHPGFEERGFEDVTEHVIKLPVNTWPKDKRLKLLGAWEMENLLSSLEGMVMRIFQKALGWTAEEVLVFLVDVRKDIKNRNLHGYWPL